MPLSSRFKPYALQFKFAAVTSRGIMREKKGYFLILEDKGCTGIGECSLIPGLSIDPLTGFADKLQEVCKLLNDGAEARDIDLSDFPSIAFALETALLDLENQGSKKLFPGAFVDGMAGIPVNGLVWMGEKAFVEKQIREKIDLGYRCIKLKVGSFDFDTELEILAGIRELKTPEEMEIRLDANGAFTFKEAIGKLRQLSVFDIHSIEQPIKEGQWDQMAFICGNSPIPIALDEELIGIRTLEMKEDLLKSINPAYLVLKPGLLGGFVRSQEWINAAEKFLTGWWVTSALESNIGLNAIAQWTSSLKTIMPQGLGTGQLFRNNISSPLVIEDTRLWYKKSTGWNLDPILE